ncbi:hypothetical protein OE88DRAFT_1229839 [Heliocybe sulcata]|uniref:Uncharacterized protein n=1 Tax=Heliocybe sulcata TaxID=5364 RepID=A0A5C3MKP6_9AGAM|nr:hypothetical protein OE88DRAFT_1229839 [Heliocybe sulcata]
MATYPRTAKKTRPPVDLEQLRLRKPLVRPVKVAQEPSRQRSKRPPSPGLPSSPKEFLLRPPSTAGDRNTRWSDVVPPKTGLTFAAIWDPDDGMVTFSGPELRRFPENVDTKSSLDLPSTVTVDGKSQILTIDGLAMSNNAQNSAMWALETEGKAPFTFACDALMDMDGHMDAFYGPGVKSPATASNFLRLALPSSAISVKRSLFRKAQKETREELDWEAMNKTDRRVRRSRNAVYAEEWRKGETSESGSPTDEGFFEGGPNRVSSPLPDEAVKVEMNGMSSKFSMTTTSTSNYVEVTEPRDSAYDDVDEIDDASSHSSWSSLAAPDTLEYMTSQLHVARLCGRRTLKKRRTRDPNAPASPVEVLSREKYAYHVAPPPEDESDREGRKVVMVKKAVRCCLDGVRRCKRHEDDRWVSVEVKQMVTQKLI